MSSDEVYNELNGSTVEEIVSNYTKSQLKSFYRVLFDIEPSSSANKTDLAYACWNFISDDKRTRDLCKNLGRQ